MRKTQILIVLLLVLGLFVAILPGCGTLMYPQRIHHEPSGHLDMTVILANGILTFFFVIPGVVAFVIDIANGTIFLPKNHRHIDDHHPGGGSIAPHVHPFEVHHHSHEHVDD